VVINAFAPYHSAEAKAGDREDRQGIVTAGSRSSQSGYARAVPIAGASHFWIGEPLDEPHSSTSLLAPERFAWPLVPRLVATYEAAAGSPLTDIERQALPPCTVAVALYHAASAGHTDDPAGQLRERLPFLRLSRWLLEHPGVLAG